jgi:nicotinamidase/pyrazinamidase
VLEALVIVDFQNDFTPGGALAVPHGDEIAGRISELLDSGRFSLVVATRDWHPADHGSFTTQRPPGIWPPHCVQNTHGAELHASLDRARVDAVVDKGQRSWEDGYSGFEGTALEDTLREHGIDKVTVVGLATDYCVRHTALDGLRAGFDVTVDRAGVRGIDAEPGDTERALAEVAKAGGHVI